MSAVSTKLAERGGKLDAGEQVISEWFRWKNLRTDRRGFETELFEHTLLKGLVTAAGCDAETHLSVVDADSARDLSHQLPRSIIGTLNVGENPAEDRCEPEADSYGQCVLSVCSADLRLKRE